MEPSQFIALAVGAFLGAFGWLLVGLYLNRRANERTSRAAARAVYFELSMNEIDIDVAATHGVFSPLRRGSFDRLLPELTSWLAPEDMLAVRWDPVRASVLQRNQLARELLRGFAAAVEAVGRPG